MTGRSERSVGAKQNSKHSEKEQKEPSPNDAHEFIGIYNNANLTHVLTSLIGVHLRVETKNKDEYEGIFITFSPDLEIVLEVAHKVDPNNQDIVDPKHVEEKMVFPLSSVVRYFAIDVDMEFAMKETFMTDTQISQNKMNGESTMRELEMWQPPDDDGIGGGIEDDLNSKNGWSAHDMFAKNEERFGLKTSYDPNMSAYTVPLNRDRLDSEAEEKAARIAASIEGDGTSRHQVELENGDEEEAFSAVVRPDRRNGRERESPGEDRSSAYVPPGKRDSRGGGYSRGRSQRTPPPNKYDGYEDRDHRQRDDRRDRYSGGRSGSHRDDRGYDRGHQDRDRGHQSYHRDRDDRSYGREDRGYNRQDSHGKKDEYRNSYSQDSHRGGFQDHRSSQAPRPPSSSSHDNRRDDRKSLEKVSPLPPQDSGTGGGGGNDGRKSAEANRSPETETGLPQRETIRRKPEKTKEQSTSELHDFHQKFNLKLTDNGVPLSQISPGTPTVSINPEGGGQPSPRGGGEVHQPAPSPRESKTPTPKPSPKPTTPTQNLSSPANAGPPNSSPPDTLKKSTLNPNAKEFTLNPGAKEFTPRVLAPRPSATPPRPQTPGTPGQMQAPNMYAGIIQVQNQGVPPQHVAGIAGTPFTPANNNQRPLRPNSKEGGHLRPDLPSPLQVQQVTGQPILAQAQLHPPGYFPPGQMQYVPAPGQPHIMRLVPPGMVPANLVVPLSGQGAAPTVGVPEQQQTPQFVPSSQYQSSPAGPPQMWTQQVQVMTTPSQIHPPTGPPQQAPVPHNTVAATPPAQGHTPAPSPGPQIIGYAQQGQPNSLPNYHPMIIMPSGAAGLPQFHQTTPISAGPPMAGGAPGQMMAGQPVTSLPNVAQFPYVQGGQPIQMLAQNHHPPQ